MSPDSVKTHVKFKARHGLNYPLIADTGHLVCKEYGVWAKKSMFGKKYWGVNRTTFVIDSAGRILSDDLLVDRLPRLDRAEPGGRLDDDPHRISGEGVGGE